MRLNVYFDSYSTSNLQYFMKRRDFYRFIYKWIIIENASVPFITLSVT